MIGTSPPMQHLQHQIQQAARHTATVLIQGETGTGKELVAKAIHQESRRKGRFIALDCGALPDDLVESELFGYRKGAFTNASNDKEGLYEAANHGTLFLDEIGNTSMHFQAKLLRLLQEGTSRRLGSTTERSYNVRVLAATNMDLAGSIIAGAFRQDLRYRFTITIPVPPLRDRGGDIDLLAHYVLGRLSTPPKILAPQSRMLLQRYDYPGNVRELESIITAGYYHAPTQRINPEHLPIAKTITPQPPSSPAHFWELAHAYRQRRLSHKELEHTIREGLRTVRGNYRHLVTHLGLPEQEYKRFMDFLRRHRLNVDYRQFRGTAQ
jgi:transcriptional regulator with PAS, ATPase and Fis domain